MDKIKSTRRGPKGGTCGVRERALRSGLDVKRACNQWLRERGLGIYEGAQKEYQPR